MQEAWPLLESTPLIWNWHMDTLCGYLEAFYTCRDTTWPSPRVIFNVPPGATKSMLASVLAPAWVWTRDPGHRFLCGTNEETLATRDSLKMRRLVESEWYQERWPIKIQVDQREKTYWENTAGGFRQSLGFKAQVTGKRGDTLIIDDPHDAKQADSEQTRNEVIRAWREGWSTRLNQPARSGVCLIMQRVHEGDLTGHVTSREGTKWKRVLIPMRYDGPQYDAAADIARPDLNDPRSEEGELFFPERFPAIAVDDMEIELGPYGTACQHQQHPAPRGGGELKVEWFLRYPKSEEAAPGYRYILVDPGGERKPGRQGRKDYTAMIVIETRSDQNIYVIDAIRDRVGLDERVAQLFRWHQLYLPRVVAYERYGKDSDVAAIRSEQNREQYRFHVEEVGGQLSKEDRIRRLIPRLAAGRVWFPEKLFRTQSDGRVVDVIDAMLDEEVRNFPFARKDDFLDCLSRLEDLEAKNLLKFPLADTKPPRTKPRGGRGQTWMSH